MRRVLDLLEPADPHPAGGGMGIVEAIAAAQAFCRGAPVCSEAAQRPPCRESYGDSDRSDLARGDPCRLATFLFVACRRGAQARRDAALSCAAPIRSIISVPATAAGCGGGFLPRGLARRTATREPSCRNCRRPVRRFADRRPARPPSRYDPTGSSVRPAWSDPKSARRCRCRRSPTARRRKRPAT